METVAQQMVLPLSLRSEEKTGDGPTELTRREGRSCFITTCPLYTAEAHFGETDGRAHYETDSQREFGTFRGLRKGKERDGRWKEEWRLPFWKERKEFLPCPTSLSAAVCIRAHQSVVCGKCCHLDRTRGGGGNNFRAVYHIAKSS